VKPTTIPPKRTVPAATSPTTRMRTRAVARVTATGRARTMGPTKRAASARPTKRAVRTKATVTDRRRRGRQGSSDSDKEGKTNRSITDALKELEPTQRKVLYLHKNKKRSVTRIAEKMQMSEDEVKSLATRAPAAISLRL
jgi:DNA-directed RNA polymerase specialized sigma24 family protein